MNVTERIEEIRSGRNYGCGCCSDNDPNDDVEFLLKAYDAMRGIAFLHLGYPTGISGKEIYEFLDERLNERMK